jgi:tetratricopeptide (TPR) repeat protein
MSLRTHLFAVVAASLVLAPVSHAQEWRGGKARVEGTVKNAKGEPLENVKISMRWGQSGHGGPDITTNKKGKWAIFGLSGGPWDVDFTAPGYQPKKISIQLSEAERNPAVDITLEPEVKKEPAHEEIMVGGKKISKETAAALEAGQAALDKKDYAAARAEYLKAVAELPDNTSVLMRIAVTSQADNKPDDALKYAKMVTDKEPDNANAWLMIAGIELERGHFDAGKEAIAKVPDDKVSDAMYLNMGIIMFNKNNHAAADEYFSKAIAKKADNADAYYYRGLARYQSKQQKEAKADFQKYLELDPNGKEVDTVKEILKTIK